ncbi:putative ABC transporter permease subunit [Brevibacillus sp. 179-C9.3 HS]|uniref:putative ABC transporter permease subunit n=1 Tax=unclassified Brevibacillus TaxID=2684853 RepID=UPI00399FB109
MNKVLILTRMMMKNAEPAWRMGKGSGWKTALLYIVIAIGVLPVVASAVVMISELYDGLAPLGQEGAILGLGVAMSSLAIFLFGILYVLSVFYYSKDVEHLLPMPFAPGHILGAKFALALLYEYYTALVFLGPLFITYGVKSGAGIIYYLLAILVFLIVPVLPLVFAALIVMLFMSFTNVKKYKERFRIIGGLIGIGIVVGLQAMFQRQSSGSEFGIEQFQQMLLTQENGLLSLVTQLFPGSNLAALALVDSGTWGSLGYLIAFLLVAMTAVAVLLYVGQHIYFSGVMGMSESVAKRKEVVDTAFAKLIQKRPAVLAYALKEWKMLWRTPAFLMNCSLSSILIPILVLIPLLSRRDSGETIAFIQMVMQKESVAGMSIAIAFAAFLLMGAMNSTSVTAISREGQGFFTNKLLPMPYRQILLAKLFPGLVLSAVSMLLLLAEAVWLLQLSPTFIMLAIVSGISGLIFINLVGIIVDLQLPKLRWSSEQEAVKQNLNPLFPLVIGLMAGGLVVLTSFSLGISMLGTALGIFVLFTLINIFLYRLLVTKGPIWLEQIEG